MAPMTRPRSELVDRENGGFYHLGARCVRRAMLCGKDPVTKRDFSHRRAWIENLMLQLAEVFTVHVDEYAVMSNHYHITVDYRPQERFELSDEEVARRWLKVYPPSDPTTSRTGSRACSTIPNASPCCATAWATCPGTWPA